MSVYLFMIIYIRILLCNKRRNSKKNIKFKNYFYGCLNYKNQSLQYFNMDNANDILFCPYNGIYKHFLQMRNLNGLINALKMRLEKLKNRLKIFKKLKKIIQNLEKKFIFTT